MGIELKTWMQSQKSKNLQMFGIYCQEEWQNICDGTIKFYSNFPHSHETRISVNGKKNIKY